MNSRLKNLREMLDYTQQDLAEELGISRQSLISLERGKCKPSIDLAREIADFFEIPIELIFYPASARRNSAETGPRHIKKLSSKGGNVTKKEKRELAPWSGFTPFRELNRMHEEIDRMFEDSIFKERSFPLATPTVDVIDKGDVLKIIADLPGVEEKDVEIEVHEDYIKIEGERKEEKEVKKDNYYHRESALGSFSRTVPLPVKIRVNQAKARLENGRLKVILPKLELKEGNIKKLKLGE